MTPPFDSSLQLHQRLFCLGFPSFPSKRKSKAGVGGWVGNLYVWCRKVLRDVLTRVRSSQENAGSRIRLRGTPLGTEGAGATKTALLREGGDQEGKSAPFLPSRAVSAGRCVNLWEPPSGELWVPAAQMKLSWFLAPSFGIGKTIDRTGTDGRILERQTD